MSGRGLITISLAAALAAGLTSAAAAQTSPAPGAPVQQQPRDPNMPAPHNTVPEKIDSTGSLSERLERSDGVIKPPDVGTGMTVKPPVADPGTTPVIPPPGSPGGNPRIDPK